MSGQHSAADAHVRPSFHVLVLSLDRCKGREFGGSLYLQECRCFPLRQAIRFRLFLLATSRLRLVRLGFLVLIVEFAFRARSVRGLKSQMKPFYNVF